METLLKSSVSASTAFSMAQASFTPCRRASTFSYPSPLLVSRLISLYLTFTRASSLSPYLLFRAAQASAGSVLPAIKDLASLVLRCSLS